MRLQINTRNQPQPVSRLNRLVFGVALLWLVTSVLLLLLSATGSPQPDPKYDHKNDRTRGNATHQLFAQVEYQAAARASFIY